MSNNGLNSKETHKLQSADETIALGASFAKQLDPGSVVCFFGHLGAGKTTFIKGLASAFCVKQESVTSPTFIYLHTYQGTKTIHHFDLYRLKDVSQFLSMGFDDYLFTENITCIEWPERIAPILISNCINVHISHVGEKQRELTISRGSCGCPV